MSKELKQIIPEGKNKNIAAAASIAFFISLLLPTSALSSSGVTEGASGGLVFCTGGFLLWATGILTLVCVIREKNQVALASFINLILTVVIVLRLVIPLMSLAAEHNMKLHLKSGIFLSIISAAIMLKTSMTLKEDK